MDDIQLEVLTPLEKQIPLYPEWSYEYQRDGTAICRTIMSNEDYARLYPGVTLEADGTDC